MKKTQLKFLQKDKNQNELNLVRESILAKTNNLFAYSLVHVIRTNKIQPTQELDGIVKIYEFTFKEGEELFDSKTLELNTLQKRIQYIDELIKGQEWQTIVEGKKIINFIPISKSEFDYETKKIKLQIDCDTFNFYDKIMANKSSYYYYLTPKEMKALTLKTRKNQRDYITATYTLLKEKLHTAKYTQNKVLISYDEFARMGLVKTTETNISKFKNTLNAIDRFLKVEGGNLNINYKGKTAKRGKGIEFEVSWKVAYLTKQELAKIYKKLDVLKENGIKIKYGSINEDKISYDWNKPKDKPFANETALVFDNDYIVLDFDKLDTMDYLKTLPEDILNKGIEFVGGTIKDEFDDFLDMGWDTEETNDQDKPKDGIEALNKNQLEKLGEWSQNTFYEEWKDKALVQKTKHGVHVLLKNDLGISTASTQMYWNGKRVDFRGLGKSYIKLYNKWEGKLNNFSNYFDLNDFVDRNNNPKTFEIKRKVIRTTLAKQIKTAEEEINKNKHISGTIVLAPFDGFVKFTKEEDLENWFVKICFWYTLKYIHENDFEKAKTLYLDKTNK